MATVEISSTMANWFSGLARQNGVSLNAMCEDALAFYRRSYKELGLTEPGVVAASTNTCVKDERCEADKMEAILDLVDRLDDRLEFVGLRYLYTRAMDQEHQRIGSDLAERRDLVSKLINSGRLLTYKVNNKEDGGDDVTAVELPAPEAPEAPDAAIARA